MAANYEIQAQQGETFQLHMTYKDNDNAVVNLSSYTGRMQVRRSLISGSVLLDIDSSGVTSGISGGTGSVAMNTSATGATGTTGGILVTVDAVSMALVPSGRHFYDLELVSGATVSRILQGRFDCSGEITR